MSYRRASRAFLFAGICICLSVAHEAFAAFELTMASVSDVKDPNGNSANMAAGSFPGNDAQHDGAVGVAQLIASFGDLGWAFEDDIDVPGDVKSGSFALPISVNGPFAIALKASGFFSLYKFDGNYSVGDLFSFTTAGVAVDPSKGNKSPGLSHFSLYTTPAVVPEASSLLVWGLLIAACFGGAAWWERYKTV
jgi:hypothetical protein